MLVELFNAHQDVWSECTPFIEDDNSVYHWTEVWLEQPTVDMVALHVNEFASRMVAFSGRAGFTHWEKRDLADYVRSLGIHEMRSVDEAAAFRRQYDAKKRAEAITNPVAG